MNAISVYLIMKFLVPLCLAVFFCIALTQCKKKSPQIPDNTIPPTITDTPITIDKPTFDFDLLPTKNAYWKIDYRSHTIIERDQYGYSHYRLDRSHVIRYEIFTTGEDTISNGITYSIYNVIYTEYRDTNIYKTSNARLYMRYRQIDSTILGFMHRNGAYEYTPEIVFLSKRKIYSPSDTDKVIGGAYANSKFLPSKDSIEMWSLTDMIKVPAIYIHYKGGKLFYMAEGVGAMPGLTDGEFVVNNYELNRYNLESMQFDYNGYRIKFTYPPKF